MPANPRNNEKEVVGKADLTASRRPRKLGGARTMPFTLANEICDRFTTAGFHANMIAHLTQEMNIPMVVASNTLTNFAGMASFMPLIGGLLADSYIGRYWTILLGTIIYELGLVSITASAILPSLRPPPCPSQVNCQSPSATQLWVLYISLLLSSLGSVGIRPCVVTFAANQFDMSKPKVEKGKWNLFNWYYFSMGMATLMALTVIVYIQEHIGWGWGLGIPTITMALSAVTFMIGSRLYVKLKPGGSPLTRLAQVIVAAIRKRNVVVPKDPGLLYDTEDLQSDVSVWGKLLHSEQFKWLDKAATITDEDRVTTTMATPNLWRLNTVHQVEELKCIIRMLPIWSGAAGILLVTSSSHQHSFTIIQDRSMDRHLSPTFQIPPATLSIFSIITMLCGIVIYEHVFVPFIRCLTKNPSGISCLQRMGIGLAISILVTLVSSFVEIKRKETAKAHGLLEKPKAAIPMSVFWLVPQFCLHGVAEVFMSVGHLEFLYDQSPESMRSTVAALYWIAIAIGNYIGTFMVSAVHKYTGGNGEHGNWLPNRNLNRGRLEYYYWLVSGIQAVNLVYYVIMACTYTHKLMVVAVGDVEGEVEGRNSELAKEKA